MISTTTTLLSAFIWHTFVSADLWAIKSHHGGGYAGQAMYNPIDQALVLTGTLWDARFLELWTETAKAVGSYNAVSDGSNCFLATIHFGSTAQVTLSRHLFPPHACGAMALLRAFDDGTEANPTDGLNHVHTINGTSAFLLGYERFQNDDIPDRTARVQEALALINLQTYATRQEELVARKGDDALLPTIDATSGKPSLFDGLSAASGTNNGWSNLPPYQHQARPFTYAMGATAERSINSASTVAAYNGESQNVFVAITQSDQVPSFYDLESIGSGTNAPLEALLPQFYYRQMVEMDWVKTGKSTLGIPSTGGVQKMDATSGILEWYTPFTGETGFEGDIMVSDVVYLPSTRYGQFVLVGGSAKASGPLLGTLYGYPMRGAGDWDGFISKLDAQTGQAWIPPSGRDASYRIQSLDNRNDFVTAICFQYPDTVYIIGSTDGKVASNHLDEEGGAFVIKIDIDDMQVGWRLQLEGRGVLGTACTVAEESVPGTPNLLYVGGVLPVSHPGLDLEGNKLTQGSRNSDDAFVVAIDVASSNGQIKWIREIQYEQGGRRHESISSLSLDSVNGHVIAIGNSYDPVTEQNDVFAVAIDGNNGSTGDLDKIVNPYKSATPSPGPSPPAPAPPKKSVGNDESSVPGGVLAAVVLILILLVAFAVVAVLIYIRSSKKTRAVKDLALENPDLELREEDDAVAAAVTEPDPPAINKSIV